MKNSELILVKTRLTMLFTEKGGRKTGFISGLRPNHVFEYHNDGILRTYVGDIIFEEQELILPGEVKEVFVRFIDCLSIHEYLQVGRKWWIHEGAQCTGEAEILEIILPTII